MVQYIIVGILVLAALYYVLRTTFKKKEAGKGGGCADCSGCALMNKDSTSCDSMSPKIK